MLSTPASPRENSMLAAVRARQVSVYVSAHLGRSLDRNSGGVAMSRMTSGVGAVAGDSQGPASGLGGHVCVGQSALHQLFADGRLAADRARGQVLDGLPGEPPGQS